MQKLVSLFVVLFILSTTIYTPKAHAIPAKAKAMILLSAYGTVGGTLLGVAGLAFGGNVRGIARGASLGLYAGLLFGSYVIIAHEYKRYKSNQYSPSDDTYEEEDDEGADAGPADDAPEYMNRKFIFEHKNYGLNDLKLDINRMRGIKRPDVPIIYFNFLNVSF